MHSDAAPDHAPTPLTPPDLPAAPRPDGRARWRRGRVRAAALVALCAAAAADAFAVEPSWVEVTEHRIGDGPTALTVVHLSDLHVTSVGRRERRVLEAVRQARPDLVVITGDCVTDGAFDPAPLTEVLRGLVALRPTLGVLGVPGNHEDWVGPAAVAAERAAGVDVLVDEDRVLLGGRLVVHGLAEPRSAALATPGYDLVLCHYPAVLERVAGPGVELVLAGHTHGGQVRLPFVGALVLPFASGGHDAGWFTCGPTRLFVSRGVGTSIVPARFCCRPEVAVLRLDLVAYRSGGCGGADR
jgi:predicted MPP superfamily phosphohydrolase